MDLTLTDEQELISTTAGELLSARRSTAGVRAMEDDPAGYSDELWKELVELGWTGLAFPEEHDGAGATFTELCLVIEQMGKFQVPSPFVTTVVECGLAVAAFGSESQRQEWLGGIARGERVMAYARSAPEGRWEADGSTVTATSDDGEWLLEGTALFVPYARVADDLLVVARGGATDSDALTVFVVDARSAGITVDDLETVGPDRLHRVEFADVRVPADNVLGDVGGGRTIVEGITGYGAVAACAQMVGGAQQVLDMTVEYATQREQFGTPIGTFQAIQHHCADMAIDVLGSRFITFEAAWRLSEGLDAAREISLAKAWVGEAYRHVVALGHQVHGAIGFTREHDLHFFLRHAIASDLSFGDSDFHWERIARSLGL